MLNFKITPKLTLRKLGYSHPTLIKFEPRGKIYVPKLEIPEHDDQDS